jgi:hypothetical protein
MLAVRRGSREAARHALIPGLIALGLALAGCGSASPSVTSVIDLKSPAVEDGVTKPSVRCGWGSIWIPLEWGAVPDDTKELAVYIGRYKYLKEGSRRKPVATFGELVSHIKPSEKRVPANVLPDGASWSNSNPVSCPLNANGDPMLLGIFALDRIQPRSMTSSLATRLTEEALEELSSPSEHPRSPGTLTREAAAVGWLPATYTDVH